MRNETYSRSETEHESIKMLLNDFSASESVALSENLTNNDNAILAFSAV